MADRAVPPFFGGPRPNAPPPNAERRFILVNERRHNLFRPRVDSSDEASPPQSPPPPPRRPPPTKAPKQEKVDLEQSFENLRSESECPVCKEQYSEGDAQLTPLLMGKCAHIACSGCLRHLMDIPDADAGIHGHLRGRFRCPVCRTTNSKADELPFSMRRIVFGLVTHLKEHDAAGKKSSLKCSRCNAKSDELVICTGGCAFRNECVCFRCTVFHHPKCETKVVKENISEMRAKTVQTLEEEAEKTRFKLINKLKGDIEGVVKNEARAIHGDDDAQNVLQFGQKTREELEKQGEKCIESFKAAVITLSNVHMMTQNGN